MQELLENLLSKIQAFEHDAHFILSKHEATVSRIITIEDTYCNLTGLSLDQDKLFHEAIKCVENKLFKAAHVMAWAAFMDYLEDKIIYEYLKDVKIYRPKWSIESKEDIREQSTEHQLIIVCREVKLFNKNEEKAFLGLLNIRNECAHPSNYSPSLNETLGFISQLLNRIDTLQQKSHP